VSFVGAGALLCYLLAYSVASPITHLRQLTRQFSNGDLSARVTKPAVLARRDEIGELARDFNHMASQIESLMQAQRRLIADVAHELRSPMTRLSLALGLVRRAASADGASLARMSRELERLNALTAQLLTLSRLEYLDKPGPQEKFDLAATVREIAADANFEATSLGVTVRLAECDSCTIESTPELVRSAIENLVRNAVKYTGPQTEVSIRLRHLKEQRRAEILVQDQGPGVPESELTHIFKPFYRIDAARDPHIGGAGLGLAITHRIARLHGGSVTAANRDGGGLEFRLTLPL
jgi:two-component system sensor histidine kinase CpxA